jgi:hypothetical protein
MGDPFLNQQQGRLNSWVSIIHQARAPTAARRRHMTPSGRLLQSWHEAFSSLKVQGPALVCPTRLVAMRSFYEPCRSFDLVCKYSDSRAPFESFDASLGNRCLHFSSSTMRQCLDLWIVKQQGIQGLLPIGLAALYAAAWPMSRRGLS